MELALILRILHLLRTKGVFSDEEWTRIEPTLKQGGDPWETVKVLGEIIPKGDD